MPDDVDARMLDPEARRELRSLTRETADLVARHLVVVGRTLDDDPQEALAHARAARAMAGRIGMVRQASGLAAYAAGEWNEALSELRAARRITGRPEHLSVMADCERALGRPERALAYAEDPAVPGLPSDDRVELVIVVAGARRDLGQLDAAVLTLQDPARRTTGNRPWAARLWYAYADALAAAGRTDQARSWFEKVVQIDPDGQTDAGDRLLELDGIVLDDEADEADLTDAGDDATGLTDDELAAYVAEAFPRPASAAGAGPQAGAATPADVPDGVGRSVEGDPSPAAGADGTAGSSPEVVADGDPEPGGAPGQRPGRPPSLMPLFAAPTDPVDDDGPDPAD